MSCSKKCDDVVWLLERRDPKTNIWEPISIGTHAGANVICDQLNLEGVKDPDLHISPFWGEKVNHSISKGCRF